MKCLVINIALLVTCCYAVPFKNGNFGNGIFKHSTGVTSDIIDLSSLGPRAYGLPKKSCGLRLAAMSKTSKMKPEEMGEYFEGDILMPLKVTARSGVSHNSRKWSRGVIPYVIDNTFTRQQLNTILRAMADYHQLTCLRFVPRTTERDYIRIGNLETGCWSAIGRTGGQQIVNLQQPYCNKKSTVLHELLHVVGILHEQSRPERDNFVWINWNNIPRDHIHDFDKASPWQFNGYGVGYNYNSVMHYSEYAFSLTGGKTIIPKRRGAQIGQMIGLSLGDVKKVNNMYPCRIRLPARGWTRSGIYVGN